MKRRYGTWTDPATRLRHHISGVPLDKNGRQVGWDSNVLCNGAYINAVPREPDRLVTCLRCWWRVLNPPAMKDILREVGLFKLTA